MISYYAVMLTQGQKCLVSGTKKLYGMLDGNFHIISSLALSHSTCPTSKNHRGVGGQIVY